MKTLDRLDNLDRAIEVRRRGYSRQNVSPQTVKQAESAYQRIAMTALLPPKIQPGMDAIFAEVQERYEDEPERITRPLVTALCVEGILGFAVARQAIASYNQQISNRENRLTHSERFLALASIRRGIRKISRLVIDSEIVRFEPGSAEDIGYEISLRDARAGKAKTGAQQEATQESVAKHVEELRQLRVGDPTAEKTIEYFLAKHPERVTAGRLIAPLAMLGAEQSQMLYTDFFPLTQRLIPDEWVV